MKRLLLLLLAALVLLPPAPARAQEAPEQVVVIGIAGLIWYDIGPDTPTLARLAGTGAVGALSVKALPSVSCPADGWLTLGAGARAQAYAVARDPCDGALEQDPRDAALNLHARDEARLGALSAVLGDEVQTVGPGAALAVGERDAPADPARLVVVDAGQVGGRERGSSLRAVDAVVAQTLELLGGRPDVLVVGLSEGPSEQTAQLHVAIAAGPSYERGALRSPSTRRAPYVQLIDVAPTVLGLLDRPVPEVMDGLAWEVSGPAPSVAELDDLDTKAGQNKRVTVWFFVVVLSLELLLLVALRHRPRAARFVALTGAGVLGASYVANLVPWWRTWVPVLALLAVSLALASALALAALRTRHPEGWVCATVAAVLALDLVAGARLQLDSVAGYSSLVAGRFAGIGNVAFGVYAAAALLGLALLVGPRPSRSRLAVLVAAGLAAVAADGAPPWGSDVGGVLALVPALVLLVLLLTGTRVSVLRLGLAGLGAAAVVTVFALVDHARPAADRTHLGRFVEQVADGTAGEVLQRKASAVFGLLFHSAVTALLPLVVAGAVLLVLRPPAPLRAAFVAVPALLAGLTALGLACLLGFALNDSGAAVPALALAVAVPVVVSVVVSAVPHQQSAGVASDGRSPAR